jgi:uncharacterized protein (TIGR03083 family)
VTAPAPPALGDLLAALHRSHDRLEAAVTAASDEVSAPSYDDEWTIAQVASHLGSGAEIFSLLLDAGLEQAPAPGIDRFKEIWDRWNAKAPAEQAHDAVAADAALLSRVDALPDGERQRWRLDMFGTEQDLPGLLRLRLGEHALHTWDIAVTRDPAATIAGDAVALIVDVLGRIAERTGKAAPEPVAVRVRTTSPSRGFLLERNADGARLVPAASGTADATAALRLPAEAFVRLIYGRLDPGHTPPSVEADGVSLDSLRRAFPGP